jgi:hypothetical protein
MLALISSEEQSNNDYGRQDAHTVASQVHNYINHGGTYARRILLQQRNDLSEQTRVDKFGSDIF